MRIVQLALRRPYTFVGMAILKKFITVLALCLAVSASSFGAEHVATRSAKAAGKGTYKAAKVSVKETSKVLKFLF